MATTTIYSNFTGSPPYMFTPIQLLLNASRKNKRLISIIYDIVAVVTSLYLAIALRVGDATFTVGFDELASLVATLFVTIYSFIRLGMYRAVLRYMMLPAVGHIFFRRIFFGFNTSSKWLLLSFFHS